MLESEILPNPGAPSDQGVVTSLKVISQETPYRVAAHLDFTRLKALASAERNSCEDHLWALREDSSYFAETMQALSEHGQEIVIDYQEQEHPTLKEPGRPLFWNRVLGNLVVKAYFGFATFDEVLKQVSVFSTR
jgi:hypothetical protein